MRRDRHDQGGQGCRSLYYFNPHSHEGSDCLKNAGIKVCDISIHTPTKGATLLSSIITLDMFISIHTPTKGATKQKRSRARLQKISIHTPTKGATSVRRIRHYNLPQFQSTLPRRERPTAINSFKTIARFQSTLPRRERPLQFLLCLFLYFYFNPHSHEGSDMKEKVVLAYSGDFNPHSHEGSDSNINQ